MHKLQLYILQALFLFGVNIIYAQGNIEEPRPPIESKNFNKLLSKMVKEEVPLIGVDTLYKHASKYLILDARELQEYKVSHIEGAKYIGYDEVDFSAVEGLPKDTPIVVYCSIGVRSEHIGDKLESQGFTNVYNLYGSIFEWANRGYELVDNAGYPTKKVHAYNWIWGKWMVNEGYEKVY
jgi:rhodanese-related sulfurtransferase